VEAEGGGAQCGVSSERRTREERANEGAWGVGGRGVGVTRVWTRARDINRSQSKIRVRTHSVGDSHKGPLKNQGKPTFFRKKQNANEPKTYLGQNLLPNGWAHGPGGPGGPPGRRPSHPRAELRSAQGARHYTGKLPPRSGARRPLERGSASLEGRSSPSGEVPPRSRASWARRLRTCSPDRGI
jgi:hypothetical protein